MSDDGSAARCAARDRPDPFAFIAKKCNRKYVVSDVKQ
jgi:hypothetical protein